ncbi:MAG: hypothetical protein WD757_02595, partial [Actinomycetota bacterium]
AARRDLRSGPPFPPPAASRLEPAAEFLERPEVEALVESTDRPSGLLATSRSSLYLRWRYGEGPVPYFALAAGDPPSAFAIVRLRKRGTLREAVVCELLSAPGDRGSLRGILRSIPEAAGADHAIAHFGSGWPSHRALREARYRRIPRAGITFVARPVSGVAPNPLEARGWALTLGDLELF